MTSAAPPATRNLPLLPALVDQLQALDPAAPDYFDEIVELMNIDPPFAVRIIEAANSGISNPVSGVDTVPAAEARLGTVRITRLVESMAGTHAQVPATASQQRLWTHAAETATVCRLAAEHMHLGTTFSHHMYLCGLLHDIGRFVMFQHAPGAIDSVAELAWSSADELIADEHHRWGYDHAEMGFRVCRAWGLPADLASIVRDHHVYDGAHVAPDAFDRERMAIVQFADLLSLFRHEEALDVDNTADRSGEPAGSGAAEADRLVAKVTSHFAMHPSDVPPIKPDDFYPVIATMLRASEAVARRLQLPRAEPIGLTA